MIWLSKNFEKYGQWAEDQVTVETLQIVVAGSGADYSEVLMARVDRGDGDETIYLALPSLELAAPFMGYEETPPPQKLEASLLVGDPRVFEKYFRFPAIEV